MSGRLKAATVDDRRRVVLPDNFPANSAVTIQQLDNDTLVIKRQHPSDDYKVVLISNVEHLPQEPEWEAVEQRLASHACRNLPRPDE